MAWKKDSGVKNDAGHLDPKVRDAEVQLENHEAHLINHDNELNFTQIKIGYQDMKLGEMEAKLDEQDQEIADARSEGIASNRFIDNSIPAAKLKKAADADRIKLDNLSDEVIQAMAGNTPINATPGVNGVTTEKIAPAAVDYTRVNFLEIGDNLFNPNTITPGQMMTGSATLVASDVYHVSDFIPVSGNTPYTINVGLRLITVFNPDKTIHSTQFKSDETSHHHRRYTFTTPAGAGYIRITVFQDNYLEIMLNKGAEPLPFEEFGYYGRDLMAGKLKNDSVLESNIKGQLSPEKMNFLIRSKNLFDEKEITPHTFLDASGKISSDPAINNSYHASDWIPVEGGEIYTITNCRAYTLYDSNKERYGGLNPGDNTPQTFVVPVDGFLRFSYSTSVDNNQVEKGDRMTPWVPHGWVFPDIAILGVGNRVITSEMIAPEAVSGLTIKEKAIDIRHISFADPTKNLFNKYTRTVGMYVEHNTGKLKESSTYDTSDYIPVKANTTYAITRSRKVAIYDENFFHIPEQSQDGSAARRVTPLQDGYMKVSFFASQVDVSQVEEGNEYTDFAPYGVQINGLALEDNSVRKNHLTQDVLSLINSSGSGDGVQILSVEAADKIGFIGDSYTESHYTIKGKSYINKLSLFSDYNFENFAKSGDTYRGNLDRIRNKEPIFHESLSWQDFKPKYAFLVSYTNDLKYMDHNQYANDLRAVIETTQGLGAMPLIATEYHSTFAPGLQNILRQVAEEYDAPVINILPVAHRMRRNGGSDFAPFWGGSHPGTRTNALMSDNFEKYLKQLPRPRQSLKIFRKRDLTDASSLDDLIFNTNLERAKKFKEIQVGHAAINDPKLVDQCTTAQNSRVTSEYLKLQNREDVSFDGYALISAVLPATSRSLKHIALDINNNSLEVYVKNVVARPFPTPTYYQRFDVSDNSVATVGARYKSNDPVFAGINFTVQDFDSGVDGDAILMSPYPRLNTTKGGVLTKISGSGPDTISYNYTAIGYSSDYPEGKADAGHWERIQPDESGKFTVPADLFAKSMDYDKIHFLIKGSGDFTLNRINVEWVGVEDKTYKTKEMKLISPSGPELLSQPLVGAAQLSGWNVTGSVTPFNPADGITPKGVTQIINVSKDDQISQSFSWEEKEDDQEVQITVWARYFPDINDPAGDTFTITEDSFDYALLAVETGAGSKAMTLTDKVDMHWKEVTFNAVLPYDQTSMSLKVYSLDKKIQVAKVSVKKI